MSLYVIEDRYGALRDSSVNYNYAKSLQQSRYPDCHIVELVPAKPKVQVSQEEADMLEKAKHNPTLRPSFAITEYSDSHKGYILGNDMEDRLMRAYVNGWEVEKPKRYLVRVPHANLHYYYQKCDSGEVIPVWDMETEPPTQFTAAEIDHYGLQDYEKVEVTDDEQ
jgi:hypothetical protein